MKMNKVDTEKVYQLLWEKITSLELAPGEILDIAALADEMGFSQTSIREALSMLVHDHLVEAPPRGLYVAESKVQRSGKNQHDPPESRNPGCTAGGPQRQQR